MKTLLSTVAVAALALAVAACGRDDAAQNAQNETAMGEMNAAAEADNPFADAEKDMNDKMMAAVGSDAGQSWAKKMIEHHDGAIAMARIMLDRKPGADVAKMARESIDKNQKDIADIRKLLKDGSPNQRSADLYRPAMMDMQQHMMAAKGADASETFVRKMLEHHQGAVAMSDVALKNGVSGALRSQVEKTKKMNQDDAKMTEAMLGGKSMDQAKAEMSAAPKAKTGEATSPKTTAARAPAAPAKPVPDAAKATINEHAGHDMNKM